jgi:Gpi18-like mannosyltransferase
MPSVLPVIRYTRSSMAALLLLAVALALHKQAHQQLLFAGVTC